MLINAILKPTLRFSIFTKVPKTVKPLESSSWFKGIFERTKKSPSYLLLNELFDYLQQTQILRQEFPFIENDPRFQENWMTLHTILLQTRLKAEQSLSRKEIETYAYNCQVYFFPQYAKYIHTSIPTQDFMQHFSEAYMKRLQILSEIMAEEESQLTLIKAEELLPRYNYLFRKILYENRVQENDYELIKFTKYYLAHRKYLFMLSYMDMMEYKVKWGFQGNLKLIENYQIYQ